MLNVIIIITGDFNSNMLTLNNYSRPIYSFISNNALHLVPSDATCHKPPYNTWLDLFIVSIENCVLSYSKSECPNYEFHDTLELKYKINKPDSNSLCKLKRSFKNFNLNNFNHIFVNQVKTSSKSLSIDEKCNQLNKSLSYSLDKCAPLIKATSGPRRKPWVSIDLRNLMKDRDKAYIKAKRTGIQEDLDEYKQLRRDIKNKF